MALVLNRYPPTAAKAELLQIIEKQHQLLRNKQALLSMQCLSPSSSTTIKFASKPLHQSSCCLDLFGHPGCDNFWRSTCQTHLLPANDRRFAQTWSPKWTQNLVKWVSIFSTFFDAVLESCFQRFCLPNGPKMVPKNVYFLRPPTLLKCSR